MTEEVLLETEYFSPLYLCSNHMIEEMRGIIESEEHTLIGVDKTLVWIDFLLIEMLQVNQAFNKD